MDNDKIPLVDIPAPQKKTITPPGTVGGITPHPGHPDHIPALRTYASDLAEAMKTHQGSVVKIALAEHKRREKDLQRGNPKSFKNLTWIILSILVVIGALGVVGYLAWQRMQNQAEVAQETPLPRSIIQSDEAVALDVLGKPAGKIASDVQDIVATPIERRGTVKNIVPLKFVGRTPLPITSHTFLEALGTNTPPQLTRTLKDMFMVGTYADRENHLFVVLQGSAYDYLFTGMREWENKLLGDFDEFFGINTKGNNTYLLRKSFTSTVVENRDVRAIYDSEENIVLLYTFIDPNTLVITQQPETIIELVRRFE